jgi:diguanylate cyclase (GGDEF)-like protein
MRRRSSYVLEALALASGAPVGLLFVRSLLAGTFSVAWVRAELAADAAAYVYLTVSTTLVFVVFSYVVGQQADRLIELSSTDSLTGLRNRRVLQERLGEELGRAERYGAPLSLLLIDLDGLKELNDRQGHRAGDLALRRAATAIRNGSRAADLAARWGGDEFILLAPSTGCSEAVQLAERIRGLVTEGGEEGAESVTVSIGVATLDPGRRPRSPEALVSLADGALYEAKRLGRNRVVAARHDE